MDVVLDGYLLKSPPNKRFCKSKWRERWFILKHSGQIPGQFLLEYYSDSTCRKHKGTIDLDQCEQVDAGLQFESRKAYNKFMFNIHTPKRIYYLVAETEAIMNKWVDSICSVCGLKVRVDEETSSQTEPPAIPLSITMTQPQAANLMPSASSNLVLTNSESSPYIPISECITGKPLADDDEVTRTKTNSKTSLNISDTVSDHINPLSVVPLPTMSTNKSLENIHCSDDFYDQPRPIHPNIFHQGTGRTSPEPNMDDMYRVPPPISRPVENADRCADVKLSSIPKVNWNTHPAQMTSSEFTYDIPTNNSNTLWSFNTEPRKKSLSNDICPNMAPPRPPKPAKLMKEEMGQNAVSGDIVYDIPPSSKGVFLSKHLPAQTFAYLKDVELPTDEISTSTKVPLLPLHKDPSNNASSVDDMYDFPRFRSDNNLAKRVPLPIITSSSLRRPRQHAYSNAPPGLFNGKENVMNYEFRPSLMNKDFHSGSTDATDSTNDSNGIPSPFSPIGSDSNYANASVGGSLDNLLSSRNDNPPPKINRSLKPKKKMSDPNDPGLGHFNLAPPPALLPGHTKKRSFRKQRAAPSPTPSVGSGSCSTMPLNRTGNYTDHSSSDDDLSLSGSRRNSANDDQVHNATPPAPQKITGELHYLDLDLDSEGGIQNARSPDRASNSTVYKTVDFVKTNAFNVMRQNVEETYRKNQ